MFIQSRKLTVTRNSAETAVSKIKNSTLLPKQPGFHSVEAFMRILNKETEEVVLLIKWDTKKDWQNWEKSPEHQAGHREKRERPAYILEVEVHYYESI